MAWDFVFYWIFLFGIITVDTTVIKKHRLFTVAENLRNLLGIVRHKPLQTIYWHWPHFLTAALLLLRIVIRNSVSALKQITFSFRNIVFVNLRVNRPVLVVVSISLHLLVLFFLPLLPHYSLKIPFFEFNQFQLEVLFVYANHVCFFVYSLDDFEYFQIFLLSLIFKDKFIVFADLAVQLMVWINLLDWDLPFHLLLYLPKRSYLVQNWNSFVLR